MPLASRFCSTALAVAVSVACARPHASSAARSVTTGDTAVARALFARLDSMRRAQGIPGLAVVMLRDTTVVLARGFGFADVERRIPVTPDTPFDIASVAKPISAVVRHRRLPLPPSIQAALALPYHYDSSGRLVRSDPPPPQGDGAAGGVIASAMDLARFDVALAGDRLITPASRSALWEPARTPSGASLPYGLGWFLGTRDGRRLAWHTGLWEGRYSALYLKVLGETPAERITLILLANSESLRWSTHLDEAAIERSPYAVAFLDAFPAGGPAR